MIYFIEKPKLNVTVIDGKIDDIERGTPNPNAIVVETLDATFETIHVVDGRLYLDGLALMYLITWLHCERPATCQSEGRRLYKLFPNSTDISDLVRATLRCATGNEHHAYGESAYFCAKVREAHPAEFAELRAAWQRQLN
ncbi:hypothetical protein NLM27_12985 [Bradyrhizobium sp. CCGB12]|uniref:hypothetical protein n=1 Tax=Bradyrhizobium sp. CCGB12 TaxID=2949632 RepID=UPI0020B22EAE|nr:hypothetical protein [Bradyrhizobium sp. CCGB12]MCP3389689.1 hypothetical protein [Bradyrhizobium sp. CCGB12]